jgi:transposase
MISFMRETTDLVLTRSERTELRRRVRTRSGRADDARIARVLLLLADGSSYLDAQREVDCSAPFISKWKKRFLAERLAGLYARHEGRPIQVLTPRMEARILSWTQKPPTDGSTHWSTRRLAKKLGVHHMMVARTWKKYGLQPHRVERYKMSNDPDFESKAADVTGLYMNPPSVLRSSVSMKRPQFKRWIDEIRSCQCLLDARNGTALSTFVMERSRSTPHSTRRPSRFWEGRSDVTRKIERDLIYRGIFKSTRDLTQQIMKYIRKYNDDPRPVKWTYDQPSRRIKPTKRSAVAVH